MDIFVFPGQGSQKVGMGEGLFDEVKEFRELEPQVDQILGYSVRELCLQNPGRNLGQTQYTQPALYVVNALHYYKAIATGLRPKLVAGHSLGEYNALMAAGVFDFLTGLKLVQQRGALMAKVDGGAMAAVIGLDVPNVQRVLREQQLDALDIANFNAPTQCILSGSKDDILRAAPLFTRAGTSTYTPLAVSAAFHSRYMREPAEAFDQVLAGYTFKDPQVPVISNLTARPYPKGNATHTVRELLGKQISNSVQWVDTVEYLEERGGSVFHEIGPGTVLTRLIQQIRGS